MFSKYIRKLHKRKVPGVNAVQFNRSVVSDSLQPQRLQCARPPCPSPTPGAYSNSCSLSRRCHPTISSSVVPFSSHPQSFPASGFFPVSQFFASGGQSIGVSASAWVLPMNIQDWFPLGYQFHLLAVQGTVKSLLQHHSSKASVLQCSAFFIVLFIVFIVLLIILRWVDIGFSGFYLKIVFVTVK